ncbi:MAG TPA: hypothetical protein VFH06_03665 [Candidatus Saccharimonadales bacterium]|nr:hypothetical protein [Candidatus Saccharimonadales bacterium]
MDWAQIIIVLLAVCLVLFVAVIVALVVMVVRLSMQIRSLLRSAQAAADNVSHIVNDVGMVTKAAALFQVVRRKIKKRSGGEK